MVNEYANSTIRDAQGLIVGYQPVTAEAPYNPQGYQANPTSAYSQIVAQQQQQNAVTHAAFIQQPGYVPGGAGEFTGRAAEYKQQWQPLRQSELSKSLENQPARSMEPVRNYNAGVGQPSQNSQTVTVYVPEGSYNQQKIPEAKLGIGYNPGELAIYEKAFGHSNYQLIGGGSRNALQSGMFSINEPLTKNVIARGQVQNTALASGEGQSRLGAEGYGGNVSPLDGRLLNANTPVSRYANPNNLANYVNPQGPNMGKAAAPGADIPWQVRGNSPAIQYMDEKGMTGLSPNVSINTPINFASPVSQVKGSMVGITPTSPMGVEIGMQEGSIPKPFMSGGGNKPLLGPVGLEELLTNKAEYSGGLFGQWAFGEKAPEVIKGYVGSVSDFGTSIVGWTPFKDKMQVTDQSLTQFRTEKASLETATPEVYNKFLADNVAKGILVSQPGSGTLIENPRFTYDYGEYTKWGVGAGDVVKSKLGFTDAQLNQYQFQIEQKKGIEYIPEKLIFGTGATLSTHPEKIATAFGAGAVMVFGGEVIGGAYAASSLPIRVGAFALAHPTTAAIGSGLITYGVPLILGGATYWGASEGLTATPERTTVNFGRMIPEAGGLIYGGVGAGLGIRVIDAGYIGFGVKPIDTKTLTRDLTSEQFSRLSLMEKENYNMYGSTTPMSNFYAKAALDNRLAVATRSPPIKVGVNVEPSMTSFERTDILNRLSRTESNVVSTIQPPSFSASKRLIESIPDIPKPFDIGEAALRFGPAGEKPSFKTSYTEPTSVSKPIPTPKMQLQSEPVISLSTKPYKEPFVPQRKTLELLTQVEYESSLPKAKPYKEPVDIQKLNALALNSIPKAKTLPETKPMTSPTYSELRAMGYDWNVARQMAPKIVSTPLTVTIPKTAQQPAKTYIPATIQIPKPIYERTPTPNTLFIPTFNPEPRKVPEKQYIPHTEPVIKPIPERWTQPIPYTEPIPEPKPPKPIIPLLPGLPNLPSTGSGYGSPRRFKKFTEYMSFGGLGWLGSGKMSVGTNARRIQKLKTKRKK